MKASHRILLLPVLLAWTWVSCTKQETAPCKLESIAQNGDITMRFYYADGVLSRIEQYSALTGNLSSSWVLTWDELGRLDYVDFLAASGMLTERTKITRNADGNIGRVYYLNDNDGDMIPETLSQFLEYVYNGNQQVVEEKHFDPSSNYIYSEYFTWIGDNLVRKDNNVLGYVLYTYDDKPSMHKSHRELFFLFYDLTYLSANNVLTRSSFDINNNPIGTSSNTYTYTTEGYPETETTNGMGYTYNCDAE